MLKYYIQINLRNLKKNKFIALLNIVGLAIGISAFLVLVYYVDYESGFDQFHTDSDKIYRVESKFILNGEETDRLATASFGYGPRMFEEFPEIQDYCRINNFKHEKDIQYKDEVIRETQVCMVDSNFFSFFSFPLIVGKANEVLNKPNCIVLSESATKKFFPGEDPIGKVLRIKNLEYIQDVTVTGIFRDFPRKSHLKLDYLLSYDYGNKWLTDTWYMHEAYTYVKVNSLEEVKKVEDKFPALAEKYKVYDALKQHTWGIDLTSLEEIHLNQQKSYEIESKGNRRSVLFMLAIAVLIIVIAWINYINISTAKALEKVGDTHIRKIIGANMGWITRLFIAEAAVINFCAILLSFFFITVLISFMDAFFFKDAYKGFWGTPLVWKILLSSFTVGTIITGLIPAFMLAPVIRQGRLTNKVGFKPSSNRMREALVLVQYITSIILIVGTIAIHKQILFMKNKDLGIDTEQIFVFKAPSRTDNYRQKLETLKKEIKGISQAKAVTEASAVPGKEVASLLSNYRADQPEIENRLCEMLRISYDFIPVFGMKVIEGRNFSKEYPTDREALMLTETAVKHFGYNSNAEALGGEIYLEGETDKKHRIIGVVQDYHHLSLKESFRPIVFFMSEQHQWIQPSYFAVKLASGNMKGVIDEIEQKFSSIFPKASFSYFFLDEFYNHQYQADLKFGNLFTIFTVLAIFIVSLGILGLSSFIILKRTKEIGVRKVNGARTIEVVQMLNGNVLRWVAVAFIIGCPIAYWAMDEWLDNFASRTVLSWWIFALAGFLALGIALLTVSWQSWRAATRNPVEALRYE